MKLGRAIVHARKQVDEEFGVVKAAGVAAVIGTSDLADNLRDFGKLASMRRAGLRHLMLEEGPVLGARVPRIQIAPSSR